MTKAAPSPSKAPAPTSVGAAPNLSDEMAGPVPKRLGLEQRAHLEEQRDFLLASLADLEREHDAGDLDDADYAELRDDYTARAAETLRAIDESRAAFAEVRRPRSTGRTLAVVGLVALFAIVAGALVAASLGSRKPGGVSSGGVAAAETTSQKAEKCIPKMRTDPPGQVVDCFKAVLDKDPENVVALTWLGWELSLSAGTGPQASLLQNTSAKLLDRAVTANPDYSFARAFRAVVAYRSGDPAAATRYLADFRAHNPSSDAEAVIAGERLEAKIQALAATAPGSAEPNPTSTGTTAPPG